MIYLDNAATSWPKPPEVLKAMADTILGKTSGWTVRVEEQNGGFYKVLLQK